MRRIVMWPAHLYNIFPHYLIKGKTSGGKKMLLNIKHDFSFSLQPWSETFLVLRMTERDIIKNASRSLSKVSAILARF